MLHFCPFFRSKHKKISKNHHQAGQEKFHALGPIYYRKADGAVLVYDVTDNDTFERVINWIKELRQVVGEDIVLTICGNKCDLKNQQVEESKALEFAQKVGATHIYTSAKADKNVTEAFMQTAKRILEIKKKDASSGTKKTGGVGVVDDDFQQNQADLGEQGYGTKPGGCCGGKGQQ